MKGNNMNDEVNYSTAKKQGFIQGLGACACLVLAALLGWLLFAIAMKPPVDLPTLTTIERVRNNIDNAHKDIGRLTIQRMHQSDKYDSGAVMDEIFVVTNDIHTMCSLFREYLQRKTNAATDDINYAAMAREAIGEGAADLIDDCSDFYASGLYR